MATAPMKPNPTALRYFVTKDEGRANIYSNPEKLKSAFADAVAKANSRSPGADYDANGGSEAKLYHEALSKIYNISDYSPPGWRDATKD